MKKTAVLLALLLSLTTIVPAQAAQSDCSQAVADFNARRYKRAFTQFKSLAEKYPDNEVVHYYLALCHQAMGRMSQAKAEYKWILEHGSTKLKSHARKGISQIGQTAAAEGSSIQTTQTAQAELASGTGSQSADSAPAQADAKKTSAKQAPSQGKVARVIGFYADWSSPCKQFDPVFEAASQKVTGVKWEKKKIDEDQNRSLVDKFNVHSVPRLVILDARGQSLYNGKPPQDEDSLIALIKEHD